MDVGRSASNLSARARRNGDSSGASSPQLCVEGVAGEDSTLPVTRHIRSRRIRQCSAAAATTTPPATTHRRCGQPAVSVAAPPGGITGSCHATRPRCHTHRRPAVIRGDARRRPCHCRRLLEASAAPAPLLRPGSSSGHHDGVVPHVRGIGHSARLRRSSTSVSRRHAGAHNRDRHLHPMRRNQVAADGQRYAGRRPPPAGLASRPVGVDAVRARPLELLAAVASREQSDAQGTGPLCDEQVPDAVAHHEAVRRVDPEPAGAQRERCGSGLARSTKSRVTTGTSSGRPSSASAEPAVCLAPLVAIANGT